MRPLDPVAPDSPIVPSSAYQTSTFTCGASYSYPLKLPPGTNGLTPEITLTYNSHASKGVSGILGLGWDFNGFYIQRDANYTPNDTTDDEFDLIFNGEKHDLVAGADGRYYTKIETNWYVKKESSGGNNEGGAYWKVITKDGTVYRFGYNSDSETKSNYETHVWRWSLDEVKDTHSNTITYAYSEDSLRGLVHLENITYNTDGKRFIDFKYEATDRPDNVTQFIHGSNVTENKRLEEIEVKVDGSLVRKYKFSYQQSSVTPKSVLVNITEYGSDGSTTLPATKFAYSSTEKNWEETTDYGLPVFLLQELGGKTYDQGVRFGDINGDGLIDLIKAYEQGGTTTRTVYTNNGTGWKVNGSWSFPETFIGYENYDFGVRLVDVNGDGLDDILAYKYPETDKTYINNGTAWVEESTIYQLPEYIRHSTDAGSSPNRDYGIEFADVNGDGLVDVLRGYEDSSIKRVYINNGTGWENQSSDWILPEYFVKSEGTWDLGTRVVDVNGDGLADIVRSYKEPDQAAVVKTYLNNGSGWVEEKVNWVMPELIVSASTGMSYDWGVRFADVNGDGLVDVVRSFYKSGESDVKRVYINNGTGWENQSSSWTIPAMFTDGGENGLGTQLVDVDGDGLIDFVRGYDSDTDVNKTWLNNGTTPDLLAMANNSMGGVTSLTYIPSTVFDNTNLSQVFLCVNSTTESNNMSDGHGVVAVTSYKYADGVYDYTDREFRGFGYVNVTDALNSSIEHRFHQDDGSKGREYEVSVKDNSGNPYADTLSGWASSLSNGVYTVTLDNTTEYAYDGSASNPKITRTLYEYDAYGNVNGTSFLGEVGESGDEKYVYNYYVYNATAWIVDRVKNSTLFDSGSNKISSTVYYYDGNANLDDTPTKGDITKVVRWLSGGSNPETLYGYDSYGNVINKTDGEGRVTKYSYGARDTTYTFPDNVTNALSRITGYYYNVSTGNLVNVTDPNGFVSAYEYDVFGRIVNEIRPYDSSGSPTVNYTYFWDGVAPEGVLVKRRKAVGGGTLDFYTFVDGFGRVIQSRSEAEGGTNQVVVNTFYDVLGRVSKQSVPHFQVDNSSYMSPDLSARNTTYLYDAAGRVVNQINTNGSSRVWVFDHWKVNLTDENGHRRAQWLDAFGRVDKVKEYNNGSTYTTQYAYDARDNIVNITDDAGNVFKFEYDTLGRKTKMVDPDLGTWEYGYDGVGNLVWQLDARNTNVSFTYDALNRVTSVNYPSDTDATYEYDTNTVGTLYRVNDSAGASTAYTYDNRLRKTQEVVSYGGRSWTKVLGYDSMDRMVNTTFPGGELVNLTYNSQGLLENLSGVVEDFDYSALGKMTSKGYKNGKTTSLNYNADDFRLSGITTDSIQGLSYSYDSVGNIVGIVESAGAGFQQAFSYDGLDRLVSAVEEGGFANYSIGYTYSTVGNIIKVSVDGVVDNFTYGQNAGPHALTYYTNSTRLSGGGTDDPVLTLANNAVYTLSGELTLDDDSGIIGAAVIYYEGDHTFEGDVTFDTNDNSTTASDPNNITYDSNGNAQQGFGLYMEYDEANRLKRVKNQTSIGNTIAEYSYNSEGKRFKKTEYNGGQVSCTTYYIGKDFETKVCGDDEYNTTYYYANGELVGRKDQDGSKYYYHNDHLGGTHVVTNQNGAVVERTRYYPFGKILAGGDSRNLFTGQEWDTDTSLYYYGARYYNPTLMRWIQGDPEILEVYDPQDLNRYAYVRNNPLKYEDPSGSNPLLASAAVGGALSVGIDYVITTQIQHQSYSVEQGVRSFAVGAVAGATGAGVAGLASKGAIAAAALTGSATVGTAVEAAGIAASGVAAGQAARATANVLSGQPATQGLGQPQGMATDAAAALAGAAISNALSQKAAAAVEVQSYSKGMDFGEGYTLKMTQVTDTSGGTAIIKPTTQLGDGTSMVISIHPGIEHQGAIKFHNPQTGRKTFSLETLSFIKPKT